MPFWGKFSDYLCSADTALINSLNRVAVPILRISLAIVFIWFGALKIFGASPVVQLVQNTYSFFPYPAFIIFLGIWEVAIGVGLLFKVWLRGTLSLLLLQMSGTFLSLILLPQLFFQNNNFFLITMEGEFVVKNLVLVAAALVIAGFELKPLRK